MRVCAWSPLRQGRRAACGCITDPPTSDLHAVSRTKARETHDPAITEAGKLINRVIKTAFHHDQVNAYLRDGITPPGHTQKVLELSALFRPSSLTFEN